MKYAYVTLTSNDLFVPGAVAVIKSIAATQTTHPVYCMVSEDVSSENCESIKQAGAKVLIVPKIHSSTSGESGDRFEIGKNWLTFTKLNVFNLTEFDKIVYIDADALVRDNIDEMFDFDCPSGYLLAHTGELEAGVLVLEPSAEVFKDLLLYKDQENWVNHDQSLLNWYFLEKTKNFHELDNAYHFCHKLYHNHDPRLINKGKVKIIEFNGYKPWIPDRWKDGEDFYYTLWKNAYEYEPK